MEGEIGASQQIGEALAKKLLSMGGKEILKELYTR